MRSVTSTLGSVRTQVGQLSSRFPIPGRTSKKATRRVTARNAGLGLLALSTLVGAAFAATRNRFETGASTVGEVTSLADGRLVISLDDGACFVVSRLDTAQAKTIATTGAHVAYRMTRNRTLDGIPAGMVFPDDDSAT